MVGKLRKYTDSGSTDKIRECIVKAVAGFQARLGHLGVLEVSGQRCVFLENNRHYGLWIFYPSIGYLDIYPSSAEYCEENV